jgi:hypothetical protein
LYSTRTPEYSSLAFSPLTPILSSELHFKRFY